MKIKTIILVLLLFTVLSNGHASPYTAWLTKLDSLLSGLPVTLTPNSKLEIEQHKAIAPPPALEDYHFWFRVFEKHLLQIGHLASQKDIYILETFVRFKPASAYQYYNQYCNKFADYLLQSGPILTQNERILIDWYLKAKPETIPYQFAQDASLVWQNQWNRLHQRFVRAGSSNHEILDLFKTIQPTNWQHSFAESPHLTSEQTLNSLQAKTKSDLEELLKNNTSAVSDLLYEYRHIFGKAWLNIHRSYIERMHKAQNTSDFSEEDKALLKELTKP